MSARISGFADEISQNIDEQVSGLAACGVRNIALRGAMGKNVMKWSPAECETVRKALRAGGVGVSEIGSPVGKTAIDEPFEPTADALAHAVELAKFFQTSNIRLFSFYPPKGGGKITDHRDEVIRRVQAMADQVAREPVVLMMENEADIYGDQPTQCLDIFKSVKSDRLFLAFDFANFISRATIDVYRDAWKPLQTFVRHIHVKDWMPGEPHARVAGEGLGCIPQIVGELAAARYAGFMTLEPHLAKGGQFSGFTGLDLFKSAATALVNICRRAGLATQ